MITRERIIEALQQVNDPELDMNIWFLGLIYDIDIENRIVFLRMTFTTPFCPYGPSLVESIRKKIIEVTGAEDVIVEIVTEPPWQPSQEVRDILGV